MDERDWLAERFEEHRAPLRRSFLTAAREGDFEALLEVLDPEVVLRADFGPLAGGLREVRRAAAVAGQALTYSQLGLLVHPALVNGVAGAVSTRDGEPFSVGAITVRGGKIVGIDILADSERLRGLDLAILDNWRWPFERRRWPVHPKLDCLDRSGGGCRERGCGIQSAVWPAT